MADLGCAAPAEGMAPWCAAGQGWAAAPPQRLAPGRHVLVGLSIALAATLETSAAFGRPLHMSALALRQEAAGAWTHFILVRPESAAEQAEVNDALRWFIGYLLGKTPGTWITGSLAAQLERWRDQADTPLTPTAHGFRFQQPDGTRAALRRVGRFWVVIAQPPETDGVLVTLLSEQIKGDPAAAPGSTPPP